MATLSNTSMAQRAIKDIYGVSQLVRTVKDKIEQGFSLLWVEGEISNLAIPSSGHMYFTLKDDAAQIRCVMFKTKKRLLRFTPQQGQQVLMRVRMTIYEARGDFQVIVEHMEEAGSGALQRAYDALHYRLRQEGIFDERHKQALPRYPEQVGIISSPTGAAVQDIITVLQRRFPSISIILYPAQVQGVGAATQIQLALEQAQMRQECDVLIIGRGGGSLEDLWAFNDEQLARAVLACPIPTISAVGHEVDDTIIDFVADVRAATPSAAAELAVPVAAALAQQITQQQQRLWHLLSQRLSQQQQQLQQLKKRMTQPQHRIRYSQQQVKTQQARLQYSMHLRLLHAQQSLEKLSSSLRHPAEQLREKRYQLAHWQHRLATRMRRQQAQWQQRYHALHYVLLRQAPLAQIKDIQYDVAVLREQLEQAMHHYLARKKVALQQQVGVLSAVNPLNVLQRGYSLTTRVEDNTLVTKGSQVTAGEQVNISLQQGMLHCKVERINHEG